MERFQTFLTPQIRREVPRKRMKLFALGENHLFLKAYSKGKKYAGRTVTVYVMRDYHAQRLKLANPQKKTLNRIGLTVTKKLGGAVVRNRCKRIMREAFVQTDRELSVKRGFIIVIVARDSITKAKTQDVLADLRHAFIKLDMVLNKVPAGQNKTGE